jgi:hypothetical protein
MKKILFLAVAFMIAVSTFAQVKFGVKAGGNGSGVSGVSASVSGVNITFLEKDGMSFGYHGGVFANISLGKMLGFQPELLFSMQGGKQKTGDIFSDMEDEFDFSGGKITYQLGYITLPLLLEIKPVENLGILVGPQAGYNVIRKATSTYEGEKETLSGKDFDDDFMALKKFDAGVTVGLQYTVGGRVQIGVRYYHGLLDGFNQTEDGAKIKGFKNSVIQAGIGFAF